MAILISVSIEAIAVDPTMPANDRLPGLFYGALSIGLVVLLSLWIANRIKLRARRSDDAYLALKQNQAKLEALVRVRTSELEDARDRAESANRTKSEFLANVSHELRTPLNAVLGFASLLGDHARSPENATYLDAIQSAGKTLLRLIDDLLDLSQIDAGRRELRIGPTDLWALTTELMGLYARRFAEKGLDFHVSVDPQVPRGLALDQVRIQQVLFNLIDNAQKFTEQGGVELEISAAPTGNGEHHLRISVSDTGLGVPAEQQQAVFAPFTRLQAPEHPCTPGTGLGLAISQRLARLMGGEIGLESRAAGGSIFTLNLPEVRAVKQPDPTRVLNAVLRGVGPARILIADDDPLARTLLCEYLADTQLEVLLANDGQQAVLTARAQRPDLILMDIGMPVLDGIDATKALKDGKDTIDIPIIAVTAVTMGGRAAEAARVCDAIVAKPVSKSQLFPVLYRFLSAQGGSARQIDDGEPLADAVDDDTIIGDDALHGSPGTARDSAAPAGPTGRPVADVLKTVLAGEAAFRQSLAGRLHDATLQTLFLAQLQLQTGAAE